jgi:O-antigen ligase
MLALLANFDLIETEIFDSTYIRVLFVTVICLPVLFILYDAVFSAGLSERIVTQTLKEVRALSGSLSSEDPARIQVYKFTIRLLSEFNTYLMGVGYHMFNIQFEEFTQYAPYDPHNAYLEPLVELGILGFSLFLLIAVYPLKYGLATLQNLNDKRNKRPVVGLLFSYLAVLTFALFQPIWYHFQLYLLSALLFGLLTQNSEHESSNRCYR